MIQRREFVTLVGGAAVAWPLTAHAQQPERVRRIGVLLPLAAGDPQSPVRIAAFLQGLRELGWADGRNVQIDYRWGAGDAERVRKHAAELVALVPDVIVAWGAQPRGRCNGRPTPCQSYSRPSPIRSAPASSIAWRGRGATPRV